MLGLLKMYKYKEYSIKTRSLKVIISKIIFGTEDNREDILGRADIVGGGTLVMLFCVTALPLSLILLSMILVTLDQNMF